MTTSPAHGHPGQNPQNPHEHASFAARGGWLVVGAAAFAAGLALMMRLVVGG